MSKELGVVMALGAVGLLAVTSYLRGDRGSLARDAWASNESAPWSSSSLRSREFSRSEALRSGNYYNMSTDDTGLRQVETPNQLRLPFAQEGFRKVKGRS